MIDEQEPPDEELQMDCVLPEAIDSDALLVAAYVKQAKMDELRRYVAIDLITAMNPWTDKTIQQAKQIEAFLLGKSLRTVE
jgi:hypothetical protein